KRGQRLRQPLERAAAHGRRVHGKLRSGVYPGADRERARHARPHQRRPPSDGKGEVRALRRMRRCDREAPADGNPVHHPLCQVCPVEGERWMTKGVGAGRWVLFWSIALGGAAFDLATKSVIFARIGEPPSRPVSIVPGILEIHTSLNPGALWGFGGTLPNGSLIFAGLSIVAALAICYWL